MSNFIEVTLLNDQKITLNAQLIYMVTGEENAILWFTPPGMELKSSLCLKDSYAKIHSKLKGSNCSCGPSKPNLPKGASNETSKSNRNSRGKHSKKGKGDDSALRDGNGGSESLCI